MMNELLKQGFYLGLGAALAGQEKMQESITKLVEKGMMSQTEANSFVDDFIKKGQGKKENWNDEFRNMARNQLKELGFVTKEDVDLIQAQLVLMREEIKMLRNQDRTTNLSDKDFSQSGIITDLHSENEDKIPGSKPDIKLE